MLPWQQILLDTPKNLIGSSSTWGKHPLKIWSKSVQVFRLWNTHKPYAHYHCCCLDGAGDDYYPSLYGLGLKKVISRSASLKKFDHVTLQKVKSQVNVHKMFFPYPNKICHISKTVVIKIQETKMRQQQENQLQNQLASFSRDT